MSKGIDYAFSPHPSVAALKSAGVTFVCRYISAYAPNDANGKNLLPAEKTALLAAGFQLVVVCEEGASRMLSGRSAGVADAQHADAVVRALGLAGVPVYFACDFDSTEAQQAAINAYLDGCASVIGASRVGIYGGYYPVKRALDAGKAKYAWQTYAWSGGQWDTRAQLRQTQNGVTVGGASCDFDSSQAADFGQWPRPSAPAPKPAPSPAVTWSMWPAGVTLQFGSTGNAVRVLQTALANSGIYGVRGITVDGDFGEQTRTAVSNFQAASSLTIDGIAGAATRSRLVALGDLS